MNNPREDGYVILGDFILKFEKDEISEEIQEIARKELRETPEVREEALKIFRELITGIEDFYIPLDREDALLAFLRPCKFDPDEALALLKRLYTFKLKNPKLCANLVPSTARAPFEQNLLTVLPNRDQCERRVVIIEVGEKWNPKTCSVYELLRGVLVMIEAAVYEAPTQIAGGTVILDVRKLTPTHALQVTHKLAKRIVRYVQDCVPMRLHAVHIVNQGQFFDMAYAIFKPFIGDKLRKKLHFHGKDRDSLHAHIDPKVLPTRYGGEMESDIPGEKLHEMLCYYEDTYEETARFGYTKKLEK